MAVIASQVDTGGAEFARRRADMLATIEGFRALEAKVRAASNAKRELFEKRGQLLPRERVAMLLDKHYLGARYPSSLPGGVPAEAYEQADSDRALEVAGDVLAAVNQRLEANE